MDPLNGHDDWVTSVAFSSDGRHIVSGSDDMTVRVWDAQTDPIVMDHDSCVTSVAFSPDGRHIVSGSDDKTVRVSWILSKAMIVGLHQLHFLLMAGTLSLDLLT